jgi:DNA-binding transcriptional ArsR family regulator
MNYEVAHSPALELDFIFGALSDATRRDILQRVTRSQLSVGQIAKDYNLTFAAVSKHLKVLEKARLIIKRRDGRHQYVRAHPKNLKEATEYLDWYKRFMDAKYESLDKYLTKEA